LGLLRQALDTAIAKNHIVTDEASAVEQLGLNVRLVAGHYDNIKITTSEDLMLADYFLSQQLTNPIGI
jgi:2-C-methyl-D-erythritol 4-phosphate cytidylyltransferase